MEKVLPFGLNWRRLTRTLHSEFLHTSTKRFVYYTLRDNGKGISFRDIAEMIGKKLNLPVQSIAKDDSKAQFGYLGALASYDMPEPSKETREILHWQPEYPSLLEDLESGSYFN